jgi:hypothetical protein
MPGVKTSSGHRIEVIINFSPAMISRVSFRVNEQIVRNTPSISLTLFNLSGKTLRHIVRVPPAASNIIQFDSREDGSKPPAPGAYLLVLKIGTQTFAETFVVSSLGGAQ